MSLEVNVNGYNPVNLLLLTVELKGPQQTRTFSYMSYQLSLSRFCRAVKYLV